MDLTEYLGLTKEEYQIFLAQGNRALKDILDSQRVFRRFCIYQLCLSETQTVPFAFKRLDALHKVDMNSRLPPLSDGMERRGLLPKGAE